MLTCCCLCSIVKNPCGKFATMIFCDENAYLFTAPLLVHTVYRKALEMIMVYLQVLG